MATARTAVQSALLSVRGLRRRRLGHIGPNHYPHNELDKWGRKKINGKPNNLLAAGGKKIPVPRASLILGAEQCKRNHGFDCSKSKPADSYANGNDMIGNKLLTNVVKQCRCTSTASSDRVVNGASIINGFKTKRDILQNSNEGKGYSSDLIVVLDMDECLIHSQFLSDQCDKYRQAEVRPTGNSPFHHDEEADMIITTSCESFRISLPDGDLVHINKRPNLDLFLKEITSKFETYIFTAAMEVGILLIVPFVWTLHSVLSLLIMNSFNVIFSSNRFMLRLY